MLLSFKELMSGERKGTDYINKYYLDASECADHVVFVSNWLKQIYEYWHAGI